MRQLISLIDDLDGDVHTAVWKAFHTFVKTAAKEPSRRSSSQDYRRDGASGRTVPGFNLPNGVATYCAGPTTGSKEQCKNAAYASGDLVEESLALSRAWPCAAEQCC